MPLTARHYEHRAGGSERRAVVWLLELGTGTEDHTGFFPVILDRTGFLYRCTVLYLTVRHAESC